jgi:cbb3-type cytochrome c oxidase subunit III
MQWILTRVAVVLLGLAFLFVIDSWTARSTAVALSQETNVTQDSARLLFEKRCATCHGKDGRAKTFKAKFNHARNLTDPQWQEEVSDERIFNSISNGKGKMPAWGKKLSDAQINALVAYVRTLK